jgi:hypothetical protein
LAKGWAWVIDRDQPQRRRKLRALIMTDANKPAAVPVCQHALAFLDAMGVDIIEAGVPRHRRLSRLARYSMKVTLRTEGG